jgi:hypothetical protein
MSRSRSRESGALRRWIDTGWSRAVPFKNEQAAIYL